MNKEEEYEYSVPVNHINNGTTKVYKIQKHKCSQELKRTGPCTYYRIGGRTKMPAEEIGSRLKRQIYATSDIVAQPQITTS